MLRCIEEHFPTYNNSRLISLVANKYITSKVFPEYTIKNYVYSEIKDNPNLLNEFETEKIVMKPTWWAWWKWVEMIKKS